MMPNKRDLGFYRKKSQQATATSQLGLSDAGKDGSDWEIPRGAMTTAGYLAHIAMTTADYLSNHNNARARRCQ